jgi:dipeptidyl aminopeptidase/acylaminoacyl peptidase
MSPIGFAKQPGRRSALLLVSAVAVTVALIGSAPPAQATAPGMSGRIAFRRYLDVAKTTSAIFTVNPDGTKARQVTHPPAGVDDRRPDWSPKGKRIAFERKLPCPAGGPKDGLNNTCDLVYTVKANGRGLKALAPCGFDASAPYPANCVGEDDPAFSPDGAKIVFQYNLVDQAYAGSLGVDGGLWIVTANGTGLHQVTQRTPGSFWDSGAQGRRTGTSSPSSATTSPALPLGLLLTGRHEDRDGADAGHRA